MPSGVARDKGRRAILREMPRRTRGGTTTHARSGPHLARAVRPIRAISFPPVSPPGAPASKARPGYPRAKPLPDIRARRAVVDHHVARPRQFAESPARQLQLAARRDVDIAEAGFLNQAQLHQPFDLGPGNGPVRRTSGIQMLQQPPVIAVETATDRLQPGTPTASSKTHSGRRQSITITGRPSCGTHSRPLDNTLLLRPRFQLAIENPRSQASQS